MLIKKSGITMKKVLVIDDDPMYHRIMQLMLNKYQLFEPSFYFNATDVLDYLEKNRNTVNNLPDVIISDLSMPKMTGLKFLEMLKEIYPLLSKKIIIYIVSSSIDPQDLACSKKYDFVKAYFVKPVTREILMEIAQTPN